MHGIRVVEPTEERRRPRTTGGDTTSVVSKLSRASPNKSQMSKSGGRGRLSVSFAEEAARANEPPTPGNRTMEEAFSFSALSNDWSSTGPPKGASMVLQLEWVARDGVKTRLGPTRPSKRDAFAPRERGDTSERLWRRRASGVHTPLAESLGTLTR